jgi:tetratricopeptide (TPR) repeat protein
VEYPSGGISQSARMNRQRTLAIGGLSRLSAHGDVGVHSLGPLGPPSRKRCRHCARLTGRTGLATPADNGVVNTADGEQPKDGEKRAELAERIETLTAAAYSRGDLALLEPLRQAVAALGEPVDAPENRAVAGALLVVYKLSHRLDELALALAALERVHAIWPTDAAVNNLASALLETVRRAETFNEEKLRTAAFWRAVVLLRTVIPSDVAEVAWVTRSTTLLSGLVDGLQMGIEGVEVDQVVAEARRLLDGMKRRGSEDPEALNLVASALFAAADVGHAEGNLDLAVELLERSLALTEADHLDRPARVGNLASVLIDRFERGVGGPEGLDRAVALAREAVADLDEVDPRQLMALNVLTNGLTASWQYLGGEAKLREALEHLPLFVAHARVAGPWAATFMENAALLAFNGARTFRDEDSDELLDLSIDMFKQSIAAVEPGGHAWATRQGALGGVLAERYHRTRDAADLEAALTAAGHGVEGARTVPHEWAIHAMTLGNLLHEQFLCTGQVSILDESAALHRQALDTLLDDAPGTASFLNNVSIVSNARYERLGRIEDLRLAVESIERALAASPDEGRDQGARCANAASTLLALYQARGGYRNLERAAELAGRGVEICDGLGDVATARVCLGTLSDVLQTQAYMPGAGIPAESDPRSSEAGDALRRLWADRADDLVSGTGGALAQRLIRRARLPVAVAGEVDRVALLEQAGRESLRSRPAVALAAAREALGLVLDARNAGRPAPAREMSVDSLADTAFGALDALVETNPDWTGSLTWLRDARGTGALAAQLRLMDGNPAGAVAAFERGHALLLRRTMCTGEGIAASGGPGEQASQENAELIDDQRLTLHVWAAPGAGGAVVTENGAPRGWSVLPSLTSSAAGAMREVLARAPHAGAVAVDAAVEEVGTWLGEALAPFEDLLSSKGEPLRLTICPGGVLSSMPWAATRLPSGALLDEHVILYAAPTSAVARQCASIAEQWRRGELRREVDVLSLAAPSPSRFRQLKHAEDEGLAFAGPAGLRSGQLASRGAANLAQHETRVLHFACHGVTAANDPLANHLVLAGDERWYASDVLASERGPRLVVLSACETATVEGLHADEGLGLASAFLAAGTPGVIASLWSVGDIAAAAFMEQAAAGLRDPGCDPALMLRRTRASQRAAGVGASGWAAFTFLGR